MKQLMKKDMNPIAVRAKPAVDLKFIPPVTLSYESTLDLKPVPAAKSKSVKPRPKKTVNKRRPAKKNA